MEVPNEAFGMSFGVFDCGQLRSASQCAIQEQTAEALPEYRCPKVELPLRFDHA